MDKSFLSQHEVITASRRFVCIRLATYEDKAEAAILKRIFVGRSGELENTTFAILSPDGKRSLVRSGRSPKFAFGRSEGEAASEMAATMNRLADQFKTKATSGKSQQALPVLADFRLALNVAACDRQPLVVVLAKNATVRQKLEQQLAKIAWGDDFIGQFQYVLVANPNELKSVQGKKATTGILVIEPSQFGTGGEVLVRLAADVDDNSLQDGLRLALATFQTPVVDYFQHITAGRRKNVDWKTKIPVTDPGR